MSSGIVLSDEIHWISFHGSYDFAYLLKILTCQLLPDDEEAFFDLLHTYFPSLCAARSKTRCRFNFLKKV